MLSVVIGGKLIQGGDLKLDFLYLFLVVDTGLDAVLNHLPVSPIAFGNPFLKPALYRICRYRPLRTVDCPLVVTSVITIPSPPASEGVVMQWRFARSALDDVQERRGVPALTPCCLHWPLKRFLQFRPLVIGQDG